MRNHLAAVQVSIRCDDKGTAYADGINKFECVVNSKYSIIPRATRVVFINTCNTDGPGYIAATFSNGFKTIAESEKWKCTDQDYPNWMTVDFDDSHWSHAWNHGASMMTN